MSDKNVEYLINNIFGPSDEEKRKASKYLVRALRLAVASRRLTSLDFCTVLLAVALGLDDSRAAGVFANALLPTGIISQWFERARGGSGKLFLDVL